MACRRRRGRKEVILGGGDHSLRGPQGEAISNFQPGDYAVDTRLGHRSAKKLIIATTIWCYQGYPANTQLRPHENREFGRLGLESVPLGRGDFPREGRPRIKEVSPGTTRPGRGRDRLPGSSMRSGDGS
jgi:hypothetical protein